MKVSDLQFRCNVGTAQRERNILSALARGLPMMERADFHGGHAVIVGGGPSLARELHNVRRLQASGAVVLAVNAAHDYLFQQGIAPWGMILQDALPTKALCVEEPRGEVIYWIASQADPSVFDALQGFDVRLWHSGSADMSLEGILLREGKPHWVVHGGSSCGCRAMNLLGMLGYQNLHLFGMDSSFAQDNWRYAYRAQRGTNPLVLTWHCGDKTFRAERWMAAQARDVATFMRYHGDKFNLTIYGDGLLPAYIAELMKGAEHVAA